MLGAVDYDLVLLDILMPRLDGYGVLERVKADERLRHIPIVVISAVDETASVVRCLQMGADDYVTKPFDAVLLRARVTACLQKKRVHDLEQAHTRELQSLNEVLEQRVTEKPPRTCGDGSGAHGPHRGLPGHQLGHEHRSAPGADPRAEPRGHDGGGQLAARAGAGDRQAAVRGGPGHRRAGPQVDDGGPWPGASRGGWPRRGSRCSSPTPTGTPASIPPTTSARASTRSILTVPIVIKGDIAGVVQVMNKVSAEAFDERDLGLFQSFASMASIALENARLFERTRRMADDLREALEAERRLAIEKRRWGPTCPKYAVDEIVRNREQKLALGGKLVRATILFSDLEGFTRLTERMAPQAVVSFLNEYMTAMTRVVEDGGGIVDKIHRRRASWPCSCPVTSRTTTPCVRCARACACSSAWASCERAGAPVAA